MRTMILGLVATVLIAGQVDAHGATVRTRKELQKAREREATEILKKKERGTGKIVDGRTAHHFLRGLAGTWAGTANGEPVTVEYRVTADESVVVETLFKGTPRETLTVYSMDEGDLFLIHYSLEKNQPRMEFRRTEQPLAIRFEFTRSQTHMHDGDLHAHSVSHHLEPRDTLTPEDDVLTSTWTIHDHEQESGKTVLVLERRK